MRLNDISNFLQSAKMKIALIFLFAIFAIGTASPRTTIKTEVTSQDCDGTICGGGCCEGNYQWFCCPDGIHCALNPSYCSASASDVVPQVIGAILKNIPDNIKGQVDDCPALCDWLDTWYVWVFPFVC